MKEAKASAMASQLDQIRERIISVAGQDPHPLIAVFQYQLKDDPFYNNNNSHEYDNDNKCRERGCQWEPQAIQPTPRENRTSPTNPSNDATPPMLGKNSNSTNANHLAMSSESPSSALMDNVSFNVTRSDREILFRKLQKIHLDNYFDVLEWNGYRNWGQFSSMSDNEMILMLDRCRFPTRDRITLLLGLKFGKADLDQ
jgi:hypothetical protein